MYENTVSPHRVVDWSVSSSSVMLKVRCFRNMWERLWIKGKPKTLSIEHKSTCMNKSFTHDKWLLVPIKPQDIVESWRLPLQSTCFLRLDGSPSTNSWSLKRPNKASNRALAPFQVPNPSAGTEECVIAPMRAQGQFFSPQLVSDTPKVGHRFSKISAQKRTGQAPQSSSRLQLHTPVPCVFETVGPLSKGYTFMPGFVHFLGGLAPRDITG